MRDPRLTGRLPRLQLLGYVDDLTSLYAAASWSSRRSTAPG